MIEELTEASGRNVSRETYETLEHFVELIREESQHQNLIARSTLDHLWSRHVLDSVQLLRFVQAGAGTWLDVGSGAGFPGIVLAVMSPDPITLLEPRRLRAEFLQRCVDRLNLGHARVLCTKVERVTGGGFDMITARAVASAAQLLAMTYPLSRPATRWILPKGRSGAKELAEAQRAWQGRFRVEPSITDADAVILLADGVQPRGGASR